MLKLLVGSAAALLMLACTVGSGLESTGPGAGGSGPGAGGSGPEGPGPEGSGPGVFEPGRVDYGTLETSPKLGKPGELKAIGAYRLTPTGLRSENLYYALRQPFSSDMARIYFLEESQLRWARINDLKAAKNQAEYEAVRKNLPSTFNIFVEWSPLPGEANIIYAANQTTKQIVRYNVDTQTSDNVVSYDPQDGTPLSPLLKGWTIDQRLVACINREEYDTAGCWEIDVQAKTRKRYFGSNVELRRWPNLGHGHSCTRPNHMQQAFMSTKKLVDPLNGTAIATLPNTPNNRSLSHCSWTQEADWFIADDNGLDFEASAIAGRLLSAPHIDSWGLQQCWIDGACKVLYTQKSAGSYTKGADMEWNYQATMINTLSPNGRSVLFVTTEGKYSRTDYNTLGKTPWQDVVLYLVELAPVDAVVRDAAAVAPVGSN